MMYGLLYFDQIQYVASRYFSEVRFYHTAAKNI